MTDKIRNFCIQSEHAQLPVLEITFGNPMPDKQNLFGQIGLTYPLGIAGIYPHKDQLLRLLSIVGHA
jgi:hypothetical protein